MRAKVRSHQMKNMVKLLPLLLSLALISCTVVQNGTVIGKRHRQPEPGFRTLGDVYILEVEKPGPNGHRVLKNLLVSEKDWSHYQIGDRYSTTPPVPVKKTVAAPKKAAAQPSKTPEPKPAKKKTPLKKSAPKSSPSPKKSPAKKRASPAPKPPKSTPTPSPVPLKPLATPTPSPSATSSSKTSPVKLASPTPSAKPKPSATPVPKATPAATPKLTPASTPKPRLPLTKADRALLEEAKTQAMEDAKVRAAKDKIHAAHNENEERQASLEYQRALYSRMRQISPPLAPKIDQVESDALKNP